MGHEMRRGLMFAGALATAITGTPAAFRDSAYGQTTSGATYESVAQRAGGNYIRATDASTQAQVLTRLGEAPFAHSRAEAFANLEQAVDALMRSENIPQEYRAQILATLRGSSNFTNYNIRGVVADEMSSTEVVDAMLSRDGRVVGEGAGQNVRMETPVVPGTRSGHTGYRAERWVVEATIAGRQVLLVFTRPEECNNFAVKIIDREQAPVAAAVEAVPCIDVVLDNSAVTAAGGRVLRGTSGVLRIARRDGVSLSSGEIEVLRTCNARTTEISGNPVRPCPDCNENHGNASDLASLVVFTERTGLRARTRINPSDYTAHLISRFNIDPQSDGRIVFSVPMPTPDGQRVYNHPAWCEDIELNGHQYRLELQGEEDVNLLEEAGRPNNGSMTVRIGRTAVWQEILPGGRLSDQRYNLRGSNMVVDSSWNPGRRTN